MNLDAEHDGRIVADIVAEWAATHGEPFVLELTGPAGGTYTAGGGGEVVCIDTLDYISHSDRTGHGHRRPAQHLPL